MENDDKDGADAIQDSTSRKRKCTVSDAVSHTDKNSTNVRSTVENTAVEEPPHIKKPRKKAKAGRLEALLHMPFDVFCEVMDHMTLGDLLLMSRTTKSFRALLTSKRSKSIWSAAREAMGLPECPSDLNEMQYADLLFGKDCYRCKNNWHDAEDMFVALRLRLCEFCRPNKIVVLLPDELELLKEKEVFSLLRIDWCQGTEVYSFEEANEMWMKLQSLPKNSDERKAFVTEREQVVSKINEHSRKVQEWFESERKKEEEEERKLVEKRTQDIKERLKLKGYTDAELDGHFRTPGLRRKWKKLITDPVSLTNRVWKEIEPNLEALLAQRRQDDYRVGLRAHP